MSKHEHGCGSTCSHTHPGPHKHDDIDDWDENQMDPCCQKEKIMQLKNARIKAKLDAGDRTLIAEQKRKGLFSGAIQDSELPIAATADYPALASARLSQYKNSGAAMDARDLEAEEDSTEVSNKEESESDSEYDDLLDSLDSNPELARLREEQLRILEDNAKRLMALAASGFGIHTGVHYSDIDAVISQYPRVLVHYYDPDSHTSASVDLLLESEARRWLGTRFVRCYAPLSSSVAVKHRLQKLGSLHAYKEGSCVTQVESVSQFAAVSGGDIEPQALKQWLAHCGVLEAAPLPQDFLRKFGGGKSASANADAGDTDSEAEEESYYDCGQTGCKKTFAHDHVNAAKGPIGLSHTIA